jgi:hypothetical protein
MYKHMVSCINMLIITVGVLIEIGIVIVVARLVYVLLKPVKTDLLKDLNSSLQG